MHTQSKFKTSSFIIIATSLLILVIVAFFAFQTVFNKEANALSAKADFNPGNIIDDAVFYNKDTMNVQEIQTFLNKLIPSCDTWGTKASGYGSLNNAQYAQQIMGWAGPPYVCLNNYHENPTTGETSYEKGGGSFDGGLSAAQIIYNASQQYGINPQVILVLLKKESLGPLTSDSWPLKNQYKYAMGYACPDSGPNNSANCNSERAGFYKQVTTAAWQLKYYKDNANSYRYRIGWNDIQYSPDPNCGTKRVNIENVATLSLYIYTPYTPNDGALNNYPGTAPCGAYGNRNFFMFFSEWFGTTRATAKWENMLVPRVMTVNQDTLKVTATTLETEGDWLRKGAEIVFSSKTTLSNGEPCLRTRHDTNTGNQKCVLLKRLNDFNPAIQKISDTSKTNISVTVPTCKVSLQDITAVCESSSLALNQEIAVSSTTSIGDVSYYITEFDSKNKNSFGIRTDRTKVSPRFKSIDSSNAHTASPTSIINPVSGGVISQLPKNSKLRVDSKVTINGKTFYRDSKLMPAGLYSGIEERSLYFSGAFEPFLIPRPLKTAVKTKSINPFDKTVCQENIPAGTVFDFSSKITMAGITYFRTKSSTSNNLSCALPSNDLVEA